MLFTLHNGFSDTGYSSVLVIVIIWPKNLCTSFKSYPISTVTIILNFNHSIKIPFSFLKKEFHEDVGEVGRTKIEKWCKEMSANKISKILTYLHEFIIFFVQGSDVVQKNYG